MSGSLLSQAQDELVNDRFIDFNALATLTTGPRAVAKGDAKPHPLQHIFLSQHSPRKGCYLRLNKAIAEAHNLLERDRIHWVVDDLFKDISDPTSPQAAHVANDWFQQAYISGNDGTNFVDQIDADEALSGGTATGLTFLYQFLKGVVGALVRLHTKGAQCYTPSKKVSNLEIYNQQKMMASLAFALTFGPRAAFTMTQDKNTLPMFRSYMLLDLAKTLMDASPPPQGGDSHWGPFNNLRYHLLSFLDRQKFDQEEPIINYKDVLLDFHDTFTLKAIATTLLEDVDLALDPDIQPGSHIFNRFSTATPAPNPPPPGPSGPAPPPYLLLAPPAQGPSSQPYN